MDMDECLKDFFEKNDVDEVKFKRFEDGISVMIEKEKAKAVERVSWKFMTDSNFPATLWVMQKALGKVNCFLCEKGNS